MLECERERPVLNVHRQEVGTIYAVLADAATIRAWIANPLGASITMIPCNTQREAVETCLRLGKPA